MVSLTASTSGAFVWVNKELGPCVSSRSLLPVLARCSRQYYSGGVPATAVVGLLLVFDEGLPVLVAEGRRSAACCACSFRQSARSLIRMPSTTAEQVSISRDTQTTGLTIDDRVTALGL